MSRTCFCVIIVFINLSVNGQYVQSPCPGVFDYQSEGTSVYGLVRLKSKGPVSSVHIRINLTVATKLLSYGKMTALCLMVSTVQSKNNIDHRVTHYPSPVAAVMPAYEKLDMNRLIPKRDPQKRITMTDFVTIYMAYKKDNYVGQIETVDRESALQNFNRGETLVYRVHFPVVSPLPKLTSLIVNGKTLCYGSGDVPGHNQYVTTINLENVLYLHSGSPVITFDSYEPTRESDPIVHAIGEYGNNAQVYNFNQIDNKGNDDYLNEVPNYTSPVYIDPFPAVTPTPNRPKPDYRYYTEQSTPPPRTQRPRLSPSPKQRPPKAHHTQNIPVTPSSFPVPQTSSNSVECGVIAGGNEAVPLIFNGQSYSRGDWPWLVAIYRRKEGSLTFICAGTLVSDRHIITAAHCMHQKSKISTINEIVVKIGVYDLEDWGDDISITRTLSSASIHASYNASTLENDILVITLDKKVKFNTYIRPACLWSGNPDLTRIVGASGVVAGWGGSELGPSGQGEPRMVRIPVVSTGACRASKPEFHKLTSAKTLCAGDRKGSGPCTGDSGGGLYILDSGRWRLRGIVSLSLRPKNGDNSCNLNEYIVFTDTAQYLPWIRNIISQKIYD